MSLLVQVRGIDVSAIFFGRERDKNEPKIETETKPKTAAPAESAIEIGKIEAEKKPMKALTESDQGNR